MKLNDTSQSQRTNTGGSHFYEVPRGVSFIETGSSMGVDRGLGGREGEGSMSNMERVSVWDK